MLEFCDGGDLNAYIQRVTDACDTSRVTRHASFLDHTAQSQARAAAYRRLRHADERGPSPAHIFPALAGISTPEVVTVFMFSYRRYYRRSRTATLMVWSTVTSNLSISSSQGPPPLPPLPPLPPPLTPLPSLSHYFCRVAMHPVPCPQL